MKKIEVFDVEFERIKNLAYRYGVTTQQIVMTLFNVIDDEYLMDVVHEYCEGL